MLTVVGWSLVGLWLVEVILFAVSYRSFSKDKKTNASRT